LTISTFPTSLPSFSLNVSADLEKAIRSKSRPEQLVGSLAARTPDMQSKANVHHSMILKAELSRNFDLTKVLERPMPAGGKAVELEGKKGMVFQASPEEEALQRWGRREFLSVERAFAKEWRAALLRISHDDLISLIRANLGHWRKPKSLADAKQMADFIIDNMDPEWFLSFGMEFLDMPATAITWVRNDWTTRRKPALRDYAPYFTLLLTINIFFALVLPTQLLREVKPSHQIDLAYLYYLPFCSVFTSKDRFHVQIVPLFMNERQTFVNGVELKEEMQRLDTYYSAMPEEVLRRGLFIFAQKPPEDSSFLTTRLWDRYLPRWRNPDPGPNNLEDPEIKQKVLNEVNKITEARQVSGHGENDLDKLDHVTIKRSVFARKGKWRRFSEEQERSMESSKENSG
jgi:hypothetical protein